MRNRIKASKLKFPLSALAVNGVRVCVCVCARAFRRCVTSNGPQDHLIRMCEILTVIFVLFMVLLIFYAVRGFVSGALSTHENLLFEVWIELMYVCTCG